MIPRSQKIPLRALKGTCFDMHRKKLLILQLSKYAYFNKIKLKAVDVTAFLGRTGYGLAEG
jgi:hypothetical protein